MANDLTGDFDVVAEFTVDAVNRVLAAMHSGNRFPHSWSLRVDDNPQSKRAIRSIVDVNGDALTDPVLVAQAPGFRRPTSASDPIFSTIDPLVNVTIPGEHRDARLVGDYSHLKGVAQVQLATPTITLPDDSGTRVTLHTPIMARYFPDPNTMGLPDFLRGEIQITFGLDEAATQVGTQPGAYIDVNPNLHPNNLDIAFSPPIWSFPPPPLNQSQKQAIEKAIRSAMATSFHPSTANLPPTVKNMQFKTLQTPQGDPDVIGVLLNMGEATGDPGNANNVFLRGDDDFAFAASSDYLLSTLNTAIDSIKSQPFPFQFHWSVWPFHGTATYTVYIDSVTLQFQDGKILLTVTGHAHTGSAFPDFSFTVTQDLTLNLADGDGGPFKTAEVAFQGDPNPDVHAGLWTWVINLFKGAVTNALKNTRQNFLTQVQGTVRDKLNVDANLGDFLKPIMNPTPKSGAQPQEERDPQLAYTSLQITPAGVILHGSLEVVPEWPGPQIDFELSPGTASPEYTALKTWIPGGTIQEYIWTVDGNPQVLPTGGNTFVFQNAPSPKFEPKKICLTVSGTQMAASGPVAAQPVSATGGCKWLAIIPIDQGAPLLGAGDGGRAGNEGLPGGSQGRPDITLTQLSASGALEVAGHTPLWAPTGSPARGAANVLVHFPDGKSLAHLDFLTRALAESGRTDTATAIVAVPSPDQLAKVKPMQGIVFADDVGAWERLLRANSRPATFLIGTSGNVVWHYQGELTSTDLVAALRKYLVAGGVLSPRLFQLDVRIGQPTPNFLFEYAPGRQLTLRKLAGRRVVLVFWKSTSQPSLETLRDLQKAFAGAGSQGPVVLAINDGETPEVAKKVVAENGLSAIVVADPERAISFTYGVNIWPTTIFLDAFGLVKDIRYGRFSVEQVKYPSPGKTAAARLPGK